MAACAPAGAFGDADARAHKRERERRWRHRRRACGRACRRPRRGRHSARTSVCERGVSGHEQSAAHGTRRNGTVFEVR